MKDMKKYLFTLFMVLLMGCMPIKAQTVGYTYKPLAAEGCSMRYNVVKRDLSFYIVATVSSDRMRYLNEPTMKIRTFNDDVITLNGVVIGNDSESMGIVSGNIVLPVTAIRSTAQFEVTAEQFEMIKSGVAKIRLTMSPMNHERTFKKDKIGKKLYKFYQKAKLKGDDF